MPGEMLKGHLDLLLLSVVAQGPAHGYAVIERLGERSGGAFALGEGTVYPALHRLERLKFISSAWSPAKPGVRRRRVYELTVKGRRALTERAVEWKTFAKHIDAVLGAHPWPKTS
jgi:PadR family transcriptional regulator, regulatory protein PadR